MKRLLFLGLLLNLFPVDQAFAESDDSLYAYMVGSNGSSAPQTTFAFDQTPFLYVHLPAENIFYLRTSWSAPQPWRPFPIPNSYRTGPIDMRDLSAFPNEDELAAGAAPKEEWISLDGAVTCCHPVGEFTTWEEARRTGLWNVYIAGADATGNVSLSAETSFTVTPEPLSGILFVSGGLTLAAAYRRKKFRSVI